jgi:hypothetical protein
VPTDKPSAVSGALRRPFAEQVAFFRQKLGNRVPTARWDDMTGAAHDTGFMVAGAQKADLLTDLAVSVDRAIAEGKSLDAFRKDFEAAVDRHDWHGWTGEDTRGGRAWRTRTIYRTNTYVSYSAGARAQLEAEDWPLWVYLHGGSEHPRPEHLHVFNGFCAPPSHPFWAKFYPPSDWGCSCYVLGARSERGARRLGGDPDKKLPDGWDKVDPKTGEPAGIGKGWGYAPGASVAGPVGAMAAKVRDWDVAIGKAFLDEMPATTRDAIGAAYRRLPSVADDVRRYARRALGEAGDATVQPIWTIGPVPSARAVEWAPRLGADPKHYDFSLDAAAVANVKAGAGEALRSQVDIISEDYAILPTLVQYGTWASAGTSKATGNPLVSIQLKLGALAYEATFERRVAGKTLALVSFAIRRGTGSAK